MERANRTKFDYFMVGQRAQEHARPVALEITSQLMI